jgi:hypothetical protein
MQLLSCHNGRLHTAAITSCDGIPGGKSRGFVTGLSALDDLLPNRMFARGVHELLALPQHSFPLFVALLVARSALLQSPQTLQSQMDADEHRSAGSQKPEVRIQKERQRVSGSWILDSGFSEPDLRSSAFTCGSQTFSGSIAWCDPHGTLYPPAVAAMGVPLDRLLIVRPTSIIDENWAITECLRCRGVVATVAAPRRISRIEARRFQLAAERGGGVGLLLRPYDRNAHIYAAVTRWLVAPAPGERTVQKWRIQLVHGHGGRVGQTVILEHHRDTGIVHSVPQREVHPLRALEQLADRPLPPPARATA